MVAFSISPSLALSISCCVLGSCRSFACNFASHRLVADAAVFRDRAQPAAVRRANVHRTPLHAPSYVSPLFPGARWREFLDFSEEVAPPLSRSLRAASIYHLSLYASPELAPSRSHPRSSCACSLSLTPADRSPECARAQTIRSDITRIEESRSASCRVTQLDLRSLRARACCRLRSRVRSRACFHVADSFRATVRRVGASRLSSFIESRRHSEASDMWAGQDDTQRFKTRCVPLISHACVRARARARAPRPLAFPFAVVDFLPFDSRST